MAIADTITSMQNHTSNAYTMIGYGTDLTGINKNLENLYSSIFEAFLEALRTPDTLFTNLPKKSGSGSIISLNDTANAPMRIELGASELSQDGTPTPSSPQAVHTISESNKVIVNGRNLFEPFANGSITGTAEASTSIATAKQTFNYTRVLTFNNGEITGYPAIGNGSYYIWKLTFNLKPNTKYYLSCDFEFENLTGANPSGNLWIFNNAFVGDNKTSLTDKVKAWTFTTDNDGIYTSTQFVNIDPRACQETTTMRIYNILLVEGSYTSETMPSYLPYVEPQEADIDLSSKNLAYTGWAENFVSRINDSTKAKLEIVDGKKCLWYTAGAGYTEYDTKYVFKINWKENTQYTFRFNIKPSSANTYNLGIEYTDGTTQRIDSVTTANTWSSYNKFTSYENKTIKYLRAYWSSGSCYIDLDTFMVYEGIEELEFGPYYDYGECGLIGDYENIPIRTSGKNLIQFTNQDFTLNSVHYFVQDGSLYLNGTSSGETLPTNSNFKTNLKFTLEAGTYTFSRVETTIPCYIYKYSDDTRLLLLSGTSLSGTFTLNEKTDVYLSFYVYQNTLSNMFSGIMISKDGGDYEPYGNGTWYIKKNIGKIVLDGSETYYKYSALDTTNYNCYYSSNNTLYVDSSGNDKLCISNYFDGVSFNNKGADNANIWVSKYVSQLYFKIQNTITTTNELQTWLSTHNTTVYYVLATPTYTQITGTLAEQLENVYQKLLSYSGTTNISQVNNDLPFVLSVSALEDLV